MDLAATERSALAAPPADPVALAPARQAVMPAADLAERMARCRAEGPRAGIAVGAFGLIHAGTARFLRRARSQCDRLFVAVLTDSFPPEGSRQGSPAGVPAHAESALLRIDERVAVLRSLRHVEGAASLGPNDLGLEEWSQAAPDAVWFHCAAEEDVPADFLQKLRAMALEVRAVAGTGDCTTRAVLARMARAAGAGVSG